jgi:hypothetical protein
MGCSALVLQRQLGRGCREVPRQQLLQRVRAVGPLAGEHLEHHDAQAVQVGGGRHAMARGLLGAQVVGRAHHVAMPGLGQRRVVGLHRLGHAEIRQRHGAVDADHDVLGLQVAVHDAALVDGLQRLGHLGQHVQHALLGHLAAVELLAQVAALEVLHRDVRVVVGEALVVDADDVRVVDAGEQRVFLDEARQVLARGLAWPPPAPSAPRAGRPPRARPGTPRSCRRSRSCA